MYPSVLLRFHPNEQYYPDIKHNQVSCTSYEGKFTYYGVSYNYLEYAFNYEANGAIGCFYCCFPKSKCLGYHEGDRERLIFLLDDTKSNILYVYFNAHSPGMGMWLPWDECEKTSSGHLIAYVAKSSHAFYPHAETYLRVFGFANDLCSTDGVAFYTHLVGTHTDFIIPKQHSITPCERFWLAFTKDKLRNGP